MSNEWYDITTWEWVDSNTSQWGFAEEYYSTINQIWADNKYVYVATVSGLSIVDIETEHTCAYITYSNGYSTVWSYDNKVFLGSLYGIKTINQEAAISGEMKSYVTDYIRAPFITSDNVKYIHGNKDKLICCTINGVDIIRRNSGYTTHSIVGGAQKCFITPNYSHCYYTIYSTPSWVLCRVDENTKDWITPDITYTTGSGFIINSNKINDFYITEHTSISGVNNTIFLAADDGIYIYDEGISINKFYTISTGSSVNNILSGNSSIYNSIWADSNANINSGKFYVTTTGSGSALSVVDIQHNTLIDSYSLIHMGNNNEFLISEDIQDLNINVLGE